MKTRYSLSIILDQGQKFCERQITLLKKELNKLPEGCLILNDQPHGHVFYWCKDGKRQGITKDRSLVHRLGRRKYILERLRELESFLKEIKKMRKKVKVNDRIIMLKDKYSNAGLDWNKISWSQAQRKWTGRQSENPYKREELQYETPGGIKVRSKSEMFWGQLYEMLGIPYAYERRINLDVTNMPSVKGSRPSNGRLYKDYYPDFMLFLADGSIMIHEHLGMIDKSGYREKTMERIIAMTSSGFIDTDQLLLSYEDDVGNAKRFRAILEKRVLPFV